VSDISSGLPPIDQSTLPADIRNGSPERKKSYEAALGFERMFLQELTKTLAQSSGLDGSDSSADSGGDSDGSDVATQTYQSMLPQTLTDNLMSAGGLGLARQLVPVDSADTSSVAQTSMSDGQGQ
jgi:Rod binding domain-containing protein